MKAADRKRRKRKAKKDAKKARRTWAKVKVKRQRRAEDHGIKSGVTLTNKSGAMALQSLKDLLPEAAKIEQLPDGNFRVSLDAPKGQEEEAAREVARRLNVPEEGVSLANVNGVPVRTHVKERETPESGQGAGHQTEEGIGGRPATASERESDS